jgi:hypothetical protein
MVSFAELKSRAPRFDWTRSAVRATAVAAALTAATSLVFINAGGIYPAAITFDDRAELVHHAGYRFATAVHFIHPFLFLVATFGIWRMARRIDAALATFGLVGLGVFALLEAVRYAWVMVTINWGFLASYADANESTQALARWRFETLTGMSDGLYFLLACAYAMGDLCLGSALIRVRGLTRLVALGLLAGSAFAILNLLGSYGSVGWAASISDSTYPIIHPVARLVTAAWLWRSAPPGRAG